MFFSLQWYHRLVIYGSIFLWSWHIPIRHYRRYPIYFCWPLSMFIFIYKASFQICRFKVFFFSFFAFCIFIQVFCTNWQHSTRWRLVTKTERESTPFECRHWVTLRFLPNPFKTRIWAAWSGSLTDTENIERPERGTISFFKTLSFHSIQSWLDNVIS